MSLSHNDVRKILSLLDEAKHLDHVEISIGDYVLRAGKSALSRIYGHAVAPPAASAENQKVSALDAQTKRPDNVASQKPQGNVVPDGMIALRSPMAGTFYLKPSPDEPPYVQEGTTIVEDDTLCLIEVMKMFNSIEAPVSGRVHKIIATHGQPVALDEVLMTLDPE
jgi:acetyl-CoA carboxylase biotin carboxyl carrier protein